MIQGRLSILIFPIATFKIIPVIVKVIPKKEDFKGIKSPNQGLCTNKEDSNEWHESSFDVKI